MDRRTRVLIISSGQTSCFAERDRELLRRRYNIEIFRLLGWADHRRLWREMNGVDVAIFWFVGRAAFGQLFFPRTRAKTITVIGGYEVAREYELNHGSARSRVKRILVRRSCQRSDKVLAVSRFTQDEAVRNVGLSAKAIDVFYNAVDTAFFIPVAEVREPGTVTTVSLGGSSKIALKGLDIFCQTAKRLPDVRFQLVGVQDDHGMVALREQAPANVHWVSPISADNLADVYRRASVYFQPSRYESFCAAAAEGMACGCVPVVSRCGALPEVVGDAGYYLERLEPEHAAEVIRRALAAPPEARERARARVVEHFDVGRRAERWYEIIDEVLSGGANRP